MNVLGSWSSENGSSYNWSNHWWLGSRYWECWFSNPIAAAAKVVLTSNSSRYKGSSGRSNIISGASNGNCGLSSTAVVVDSWVANGRRQLSVELLLDGLLFGCLLGGSPGSSTLERSSRRSDGCSKNGCSYNGYKCGLLN